MKQIKVLVVDDSIIIRKKLIESISKDSEIKVVGEAGNGKEAVEMVSRLKPDIVTMDIEMPVMNGLDAIEEIMGTNAVPILVITAVGSSTVAFSALSRGALEVVAKSSDTIMGNADELISKIKLISKVKVITHVRKKHSKSEKTEIAPATIGVGSDKIVAIASSTGGPKALSLILGELPNDFPYPIVIAQHITDGFVPGLVEWFNNICKLKVKEARAGELIAPGTVYISPSEINMEVSLRKRISLVENKKNQIYHPSCDNLLSSVAEVYGANCIGVILTGMGGDGALGMEKIKNTGGVTVAQDEATCVVFGMPKVAIDKGCVDRILPLESIGTEIKRIAKTKK